MQGTRVQSLVRELDPTCCNSKIPHAVTINKAWHSQINKYIKKKKPQRHVFWGDFRTDAASSKAKGQHNVWVFQSALCINTFTMWESNLWQNLFQGQFVALKPMQLKPLLRWDETLLGWVCSSVAQPLLPPSLVLRDGGRWAWYFHLWIRI